MIERNRIVLGAIVAEKPGIRQDQMVDSALYRAANAFSCALGLAGVWPSARDLQPMLSTWTWMWMRYVSAFGDHDRKLLREDWWVMGDVLVVAQQ